MERRLATEQLAQRLRPGCDARLVALADPLVAISSRKRTGDLTPRRTGQYAVAHGPAVGRIRILAVEGGDAHSALGQQRRIDELGSEPSSSPVRIEPERRSILLATLRLWRRNHFLVNFSAGRTRIVRNQPDPHRGGIDLRANRPQSRAPRIRLHFRGVGNPTGTMSCRDGDGGYGWDRTTDLTIMSRALSPAELRSPEGGEPYRMARHGRN